MNDEIKTNELTGTTLATPAQKGWCDGCSPDNYGDCVTPAAPAQAGEYPELPPLQVRYDGLGSTTTMGYGVSQMRAYADATCAARGATQASPVDANVQQDAERYRWLRTRACMGYPSGEGSDSKDAYLVITGYGYDDTASVVDAAVDAARAAQKGTNDDHK